ncbi:MAG TPA: RDD family protein [Blastocatellia bacterium]|nr:RDD family protein [Blastocatellia bacterium]
MQKFCPYCGKALSERSKFCPSCGKPTPARQASVAVNERAAPPASAPPADRPRPRTVVAPPASRVAERPQRRFAPPTYAFIGSLESAGFGLRYGAWMFDFLISLIAIMVFTFVITAVSKQSVVGSNKDLLTVAGLTLLLFVLNFVVLAGTTGQTAGMRILGIYIVRENGKPFTIKHAALRHLVGYPLSMAVFFLGFLWMLWDPRQQGWHDKLAHTIVVMSK